MEQGEALRMLRAVLLWGRGSLAVPPSLPALLSDSVREGTVWCIGRLPGREPELRDSLILYFLWPPKDLPGSLFFFLNVILFSARRARSNPYIPLH